LCRRFLLHLRQRFDPAVVAHMDDWLQHHHVARVRRQLDLSVAGLRILRQVISVGGLPGINSHGHERSVVPALFHTVCADECQRRCSAAELLRSSPVSVRKIAINCHAIPDKIAYGDCNKSSFGANDEIYVKR
jgi:hypothetical protein